MIHNPAANQATSQRQRGMGCTNALLISCRWTMLDLHLAHLGTSENASSSPSPRARPGPDCKGVCSLCILCVWNFCQGILTLRQK